MNGSCEFPEKSGVLDSAPVAGFTIVNLKELEDTTSPGMPGIEGRWARKHLGAEHLGVSYFHYGPNVRAPNAHRHREQEEVYIVLRGSGRILLDGEPHELRPWDAVRIAPSTVRALEAGEEGLELLAVASDRPEGGDGESVDAAWPE